LNYHAFKQKGVNSYSM